MWVMNSRISCTITKQHLVSKLWGLWLCCTVVQAHEKKYPSQEAVLPYSFTYIYVMVWSGQRTRQAAESIKWRPQQAYGRDQFLLVQPQTVFSTHTKSSRSRIDKRTARATGNTRYRYSKIAPLDHKMADNCVSLARTNTLSSTI